MRWSKAAEDTPSRPLPADPWVFASFLAQEAAVAQLNDLSACPTNQYVNAIKYFSKLANVDSPTDHPLVAITHSSIRRRLGYKKCQKRPLMSVHIEALFNHHIRPHLEVSSDRYANKGGYLHALATMLRISLAFEASLRWDDFEGMVIGDMVFADGFVRIFLVNTKTDTTREGQWCTIVMHDAPWGAFSLLMALLSSLALIWKRASKKVKRDSEISNVPIDQPEPRMALSQIPVMFWIDGETHLPDFNRKVSYKQFSKTLKSWCASIGLDPALFAVHSCRSGTVNDGLLQGIPETILQTGGRWKSTVCFRGYINDEMSIRAHVKAYASIHDMAPAPLTIK
jgi:hypothetical protein